MKNRKPVRRVERSYTRERKVEVLMYLLNHRIADPNPKRVARRRIGQPHPDDLPLPQEQMIPDGRGPNGELIWYRAPTYAEASEYWKIPVPTVKKKLQLIPFMKVVY